MKLLFRERNAQVFGESIVFDWRPGGNNIAVGGANGVVKIYSRNGDVMEEFSINDSVSTLSWDSEGELLAITNIRSSTLVLYEFSINNIQTVDISINAKNTPTFVTWCPTQSLLLIGDNRGNVTLYNYRTSRKTPIMGKHQKTILTGAFNDNGTIFALASKDLTITVSKIDGDTIQTFSCNGEISSLQFIQIRCFDNFDGNNPEDYLCAVVNDKNMMILNMKNPDNPYNFQFQDKYGDILTTKWFGNDTALIGFKKGYIVCISVEKSNKINQELFCIKDFKNYLSSLTININYGKVFAIGDNVLKVRDLYNLNELTDMIEIDSNDTGLNSVKVCDDGSLIAVSSNSGLFSIYLTKLPMLAAAYNNCVVVLSSLTEVTIYKDGETMPLLTLNIKLEPSIIAVGSSYIVAVLNHRAWFYQIKQNTLVKINLASKMVYEHDYITTISKLLLNDEYVMAKRDGQVILHTIPKISADDLLKNEFSTSNFVDIETIRIFPDNNNLGKKNLNEIDTEKIILDADLSEKFLIYCTNLNYIYYYSLSNKRVVNEFKHVCEVSKLFSENGGIRLCFIDKRHDTFIYNPIDDLLTQITNATPLLHFKGCFWETFTVDRDSLLLYDESSLYIMVVSKNAKSGQIVNQLSTIPIPYGNAPLMLSKGIVFCNTENGRVNTILLKSHQTNTNLDKKSQHELFEILFKSITLKRWKNAWQICNYLNERSAWLAFSRAALEEMNIDLAIRIFRYIGDVATVWALEELLFTEDENILAGHIAALLGQFDVADDLFCRSNQPINALNMRRDIQNWNRALELAQTMAPSELPLISKEYAVQLELLGKYDEALIYYDNALSAIMSNFQVSSMKLDVSENELNEYKWLCKSGIARMALRTGDIQKGVKAALEIPNRLIKRECGLILEQMKQYEDASVLYEAGKFYDRAVASCIRCKNWIKINELIGYVRSPKILGQYGKVLTADKKYEKAYEIYKKALDYDNMICVLLKFLNRPEEAIRLTQETRSIEGAKLVAKFFTDLGNNESAIEFLVLSQCYQEGYECADSCDCMNVYANAIEATQNNKLYVQLAEYYSGKGSDNFMAGKFWGLAKNYSVALEYLIKASLESGKVEDLGAQYAVLFVAESEDKNLIYKLIDFLMGETDNIPRDPKYLFQLYIRLKMYSEAANTALIIAQDQQNKGFYKSAHDLLFEMYKTLREQKIHIPSKIENSLQLLHSYSIIKGLIKQNKHYIAARLLIRVSTNISQFPIHSVQILTSAVITCMKAGLQVSAFKFSSQLLQLNFRQKIDPKYKKKIETIVRKFDSDVKDLEENMTPCPYCNALTPEFTLRCDKCKSNIPYCIITGRHVVAQDFSLCSSCSFPGFYTEFNKLMENDSACSMCYKKLNKVVPCKFKNFL